jgi:hypothetical protein
MWFGQMIVGDSVDKRKEGGVRPETVEAGSLDTPKDGRGPKGRTSANGPRAPADGDAATAKLAGSTI